MSHAPRARYFPNDGSTGNALGVWTPRQDVRLLACAGQQPHTGCTKVQKERAFGQYLEGKEKVSSFLVSPDCINSIVTYLEVNQTLHRLDPRLELDVCGLDELSSLAEAIYRMNKDALEQRYGKHPDGSVLGKTARFRFRMVHRPAVAVYKACSCLLYQCSEGNIPERKLFKALESVLDIMARDIVTGLPDYEAAPWGD